MVLLTLSSPKSPYHRYLVSYVTMGHSSVKQVELFADYEAYVIFVIIR